MPALTKPSGESRVAIIYITLGALLGVWSFIWYWYLSNNPPQGAGPYYWCAGTLLTALVLLFIGLALGRISRAARQAELPPKVDTDDKTGLVAATVQPPVAIPLGTPAAPVAIASENASAVPVHSAPASEQPVRTA